MHTSKTFSVHKAVISYCYALIFCFLPLASGLIVNGNVYAHQTALFGPQPGHYSVKGELILAKPDVYCVRNTSYDMTGKIVLILRSPKKENCYFYLKAKNAQLSGAAGVVIGNNVYGNLVRMGTGEKPQIEITIPSVFVQKSTYDKLKTLILASEGHNVTVDATLDNEGEFDPNNRLQIAAFLLLVLPILWCAFAGIYVCKKYCQRYRARQARLSRSQRMPLVRYTPTTGRAALLADDSLVTNADADADGNAGFSDSCAICLEDFRYHDNVKLLPCEHGFHPHCLDPWLDRSDLCPICKSSILVDKAKVEKKETQEPEPDLEAPPATVHHI